MNHKIVIYDSGRDQLCFDKIDKLSNKTEYRFIEWNDDKIQKFLEKQFNESIFSFMIIDDDIILVGRDAIRKMGEILGSPQIISEIGYYTYPIISKPIGFLLHNREPSEMNGRYKLKDEAHKYLKDSYNDD